MKATIERAKLMNALSHIHGVVERRNTIPILSNVLIEVKNNILLLTATDMEIAEIESTDCNSEQNGSITTPAHMLHDIVKKLPDGSYVEIESLEGRKLEIKSNRATFSLMCLPPEDFPDVNSGDFPEGFFMDAKDLKRLIDKTLFSVSTEETRYYLNGIYLHTVRDNDIDVMRAVATDGHRLSRLSANLPPNASGMDGVIVPRKTVIELRKLLDLEEGNIKIQISKTKIRFSVGQVVLTSKLLDGTFPDYERVIPEGNTKELYLNTSDFTEAVDRVSTVSTDRTRAIKFILTSGALTISAENPEQGSAVEKMNVDYSGDDIEIGFNSRYLLDIAKQITGEEMKFLMADKLSPTIICDNGDETALYVLMPMHV